MITDKDAKEWQKMVDKLEKQNKKDIEKFRKKEASIGSFFKSCLSTKEKEQLEVIKKIIPTAVSYFPTDNIEANPFPPPIYPKLSRNEKRISP